MKILIHSNAPWAASGYGKQTKIFAPRLAGLGHEVAISAFFGLQGARLNIGKEQMRVYPRSIDVYGNDVLEMHAKDFFGEERGGLVMPLTDIWVMEPAVLARLNTAAWVPVDHDPCQPPTVNTLRDGDCIPIAMSRFGERMLEDEGLDPVYVPHGVECDVFCPLDRAESRAALQIPADAFVVGMVAANQGLRKSYPQAIVAFGRFQKRHPDALLLLHTWLGPHHQGVDMHNLLPRHVPDTAAMVCDQYRYQQGLYADEYLAQVYSAIDVLLNPSQGEGFGVPLIEAQACGTPVIATDCTAMSELVGSGYLVGGTPVFTTFGSWQTLPDVGQIEDALEAEYAKSAAERAEAKQKARSFALDYDADLVTTRDWVPALAEIEERILVADAARARKQNRRGRKRAKARA